METKSTHFPGFPPSDLIIFVEIPDKSSAFKVFVEIPDKSSAFKVSADAPLAGYGGFPTPAGVGSWGQNLFPPNTLDSKTDKYFQTAVILLISAVAAVVAIGIIANIIVSCKKAIVSCKKTIVSSINAIIDVGYVGINKSPHPDCVADEVNITVPPNFQVISHAVTPTTNFPMICDAQFVSETVERVISDMAREKPIRFSPQQLEGFTNNYSEVLGSGGFGVVYRGEFPNGVQVAAKVLNNNNRNTAVKEQFIAEVSTIGRTYHINLVRLYGFCFHPTMKALVYEYMENTSLDKLLFSGNKTIKWDKLHRIAVGAAKGIAYLHEDCEKRIIHYDIKPGNVLLDAAFSPKVADFGLAKLCNRESTHVDMTGYRGTPGYAAPELWKPYPVTYKCDVYSFGMLLFEIVGRRRNHDANLSGDREWLPRWTWENFKKGELVEMMESCGVEEQDRHKAARMSTVALWCVQYSPEARPLMSSVVKMLEGGQDILPPPNPFQYLETSDLQFPVWNESGEEASPTSDASYGVPMRRIFEIESSCPLVNQTE